jgi:exopolysaccharide biosynthesis predicted pyruvyltransferase EpsI
MPQSLSKYPKINETIHIFKENEIKKLNLYSYDIVISNGLHGARILSTLTDINKVHFLQNFDPWIFGPQDLLM